MEISFSLRPTGACVGFTQPNQGRFAASEVNNIKKKIVVFLKKKKKKTQKTTHHKNNL